MLSVNLAISQPCAMNLCGEKRVPQMVDFEGKAPSLIDFPVVLYSPVEKRA
jgi:hypothetical protein